MSETPSPNRANGRDAGGRFAKGNPGGPGNPGAARVAEYRKAIHAAIEPELVVRVLLRMAAAALEGDVQAARLFCERVLGRIPDAMPLEDIESPEALAGRFAARMAELDAAIPSKFPELELGGDSLRYL